MKFRLFRHGFVFLLIAIAVIVVVSTILRPLPEGYEAPPSDETSDVNPWDTGAGWAVCAPFLLIMVAVMGSTYFQQRKLMERIEQARFEEMPDQQAQIPETAQTIVQALIERSFTRIGDFAYVTGDDKPISSIPAFIGAENQVIAIVAAVSHLPKTSLTLETLYSNGAVLRTYHPYGVSSKSAKCEMSRKGGAPGEAIDYHLRRMHEFGAQQGSIYAADPKARAAWLTAFGRAHVSAWQTWLQLMGRWMIPMLILLIIMALALNTHLFGEMLSGYFVYGSCLLLIGWLAYNVFTGRIILRR